MLRSSWLLIRFLVGWVYTLVMSAVACLTLLIGRPVWGWMLCLKPWAKGSLAILGVRIEVEGKENLRGPALFIANHQSLIDVVFVPAILPTKTRYVAKKEIGKIPLFGWAAGAAGCILIDRKNPRAAIQSIRDGLKKLPAGWSIVVFPEGTRSHDGELKKFKKGAFHIALESGLPLVPVALEGAYDVVPKHQVLIQPGIIHVTVGPPIDTRNWRHETIDEHMREGWLAVSKCLARSRERHALATGRRAPDSMPTGGNASGGYGHSNVNAHS